LWVALGATLALACGLAWVAVANAPRLALLGTGAYLLILLAALEAMPVGFQRLIVEPNELGNRDAVPATHIELTRAAYGLDKIEARFHAADERLGPDSAGESGDHRQHPHLGPSSAEPVLPPAPANPDLLFVRQCERDRYWIDGTYRQVMLAARELSVDLADKAGGWVNRHLQYTHGYGLAMCLAAEKDDQGGPVFTVADLPPKGSPGLPVSRPRSITAPRRRAIRSSPRA